MYITLPLLLPITVVTACMIIFQLASLLILLKLLQAYRSMQRKQMLMLSHLSVEERDVISSEKKTSLELIKEAEKDITDIENKAKRKALNLNKKLNTEISHLNKEELNALNLADSKFFNLYNDELSAAKAKHLQSFSRMTELLEKETATLREELRKKAEEEAAKVERELEEYRKDQTVKLQERLNDVVNDLAQKVLGEGLDSSTQERLVLEAVNEAEQRGVFRDRATQA